MVWKQQWRRSFSDPGPTLILPDANSIVLSWERSSPSNAPSPTKVSDRQVWGRRVRVECSRTTWCQKKKKKPAKKIKGSTRQEPNSTTAQRDTDLNSQSSPASLGAVTESITVTSWSNFNSSFAILTDQMNPFFFFKFTNLSFKL